MNILIANTQEFNPSIGGVERVSTVLAQEFKKLGYNVYFLACLTSSYSKEYKPVVPQTILSDSIKYNSSKNIEDFSILLQELQIDIIMNQAGNIKNFSSLCFEAALIYKKAKVISVVHIDPIYKFKLLLDFSTSSLPSQKKYFNLVRRIILLPYRILKTYISERSLYNFVYNKSDSLVLLSPSFQNDFKKITRLNSYSKLTAISNPYPFKINSVYEDSNKENKLIYVGRLDYNHKRTDRLLTVWSKLASDFPNWSLDIVGNGPLEEELIEYVRINKIKRLNFIGFADPIKYYKRSKILCMTSTFEGFGMVLIEGAYYGCIPIAFNSFSSLSDIIEHKMNGYMIKPYCLKEYEKELRLIMGNEELRSKLRIETSKIPYKFQSEQIVKQWVSIFNNFKNNTKA